MRRIVDNSKSKEVEEVDSRPSPTYPTGSLDDLLSRQLAGLERLTAHLVREISAGNINKDTAGQLSICIKLTMELKAKEKSLLDGLSDEELQKITSE